MKKNLNIMLVLKHSEDYGFYDVLRLSLLLRKHAKEEINIFCLTDIFDKKVKLMNIRFIPFPNPEWRGWFSKMNMFNPIFNDLKPFLYVDLDTLILASYKEIIPKKENMFITLEDFYRKGQLATGLMWIPRKNKKIDMIWEKWIDSNAIYFRGDQEFIRTVVFPNDFFQNYCDIIGSFKPEPNRKPILKRPEGKAIICLHGKPRIRKVVENYEWVRVVLKELSNE